MDRVQHRQLVKRKKPIMYCNRGHYRNFLALWQVRISACMKKKKYRDITSLNQSRSGLGNISTITNPIFICVISYTGTSEIPGITMAGANAELLKFTSAADSE